VDEQHRRLVDLVNKLIGLLIETREISKELYSPILDEISGYAEEHFLDEELLMEREGLDSRFLARQKAAHKAFVGRINRFAIEENKVHEQLHKLATFLVDWLQFHIIHVDQGITRQIHRIGNGLTPVEAFELEKRAISSDFVPMSSIVDQFLGVVHTKNIALDTMKDDAVKQVEVRTAELETTNEQLRDLATHDELTGLPNRRFAMINIKQLLLESNRYKQVFSIMLIDLDNFKAVNDRFGHLEGDSVLKKLGEYLRRSVRDSDIVCRLGGDEFLIICPSSNHEDVRIVAEKLVSGSSPCFTPDGRESWTGSVSIGIAEFSIGTLDPVELISLADGALYASKHRGGRSVS
jgi:hemerythrin